LLTQGAEAHLYKTVFLSPSTPAALKIRPSKPYRHPILDRRLTRQRILQEARCLVKLVREGVNVPAVLALDWEGQAGEKGFGGAWLMMEWIEGLVVRVVLERWEKYMKRNQASQGAEGVEQEETRVRDLLRRIGHAVGALHKAGVIHGDLTTSNLMLRPPSTEQQGAGDETNPSMVGDVVLIDFGLASQSLQDEDRAVDLYVLERAFGSTHPRTEPLFEEVLNGYRESYKGASSALKRLEEVRMRGRKRSMIG
jgi:TP53 regulating kinase-like protein